MDCCARANMAMPAVMTNHSDIIYPKSKSPGSTGYPHFTGRQPTSCFQYPVLWQCSCSISDHSTCISFSPQGSTLLSVCFTRWKELPLKSTCTQICKWEASSKSSLLSHMHTHSTKLHLLPQTLISEGVCCIRSLPLTIFCCCILQPFPMHYLLSLENIVI